VGRVVLPHGLRGALKVQLYRDGTPILERVERVALDSAGGAVRRVVASAPLDGRHRRVELEGVGDCDAAEALRGAELFVEVGDLDPLGEDEFYCALLIGARVETAAGVSLGRLEEISNHGASDIFEVRGPRGEHLIPAVDDFVLSIDVEQGLVVVDWPEGEGGDPEEP